MSALPVIEMTETDIPQDEAPPTFDALDFNPEFPGSTPEAPYGFKEDGTAYKRRPKGSGKGSSGSASKARNMPATDSQARQAAGLLARLNLLIAMGLGTAGLEQTGKSIVAGNEQFEQMAYEALLTDPALCKKILGTGTVGGKAGLAMAYGMLTVSILPSAKSEVRERRALRAQEEGME